MCIFLAVIFAVIELFSSFFCIGLLRWGKSWCLQKTKTLNFSGTEISPSSGSAVCVTFCNPSHVSPLLSSCSSYLWSEGSSSKSYCFTSEKRDLECNVFFSLNNNITASNSITRTVILPLLLSGRNWSVLCSCSDISIHLCLAFNGPICTTLVSQCLHSWSIWVERFLTWELHSHCSA